MVNIILFIYYSKRNNITKLRKIIYYGIKKKKKLPQIQNACISTFSKMKIYAQLYCAHSIIYICLLQITDKAANWQKH